MIEYKEAIRLVLNESFILLKKKVKVINSDGFILAEDIYSPINLPSFNNSAVDGYAFFSKILLKKSASFKIRQIIFAGNTNVKIIDYDYIYQIMTGAIVPKGLDTIIKQENTERYNNIVIFVKNPILGNNIRYTGEDIRKGRLVMLKNKKIRSAEIGFLSTMGIKNVVVFKKPKTVIISTGDELIFPGKKVEMGQIFYSNGFMVRSLLKEDGLNNVIIEHVNDNLSNTIEVIERYFNKDLILLTGGISVGNFDFVKKALDQLLVQKIFYKGNWRPGKPLYFGKKKSCYVFALPGNPVASYVMYKVFVSCLINKRSFWEKAFLSHSFIKKTNVFFPRGIVNQNTVTLLKNQGSHCVGTLSQANCICFLPYGKEFFNKGEKVFIKKM